MALQIRRGQTRSFGKMIAVSFAVMAFVLQPLVQSNMPAAFAVAGSTRYVQAGTGNDTGNNCTDSSNKCVLLSSALAVAQPGDTIDVDGGTYSGNFVINEELHLVGHNNPTITNGAATHVVTLGSGASGTSIDGFTIRSRTHANTVGLKIAVGAHLNGLIVKNNIFETDGNTGNLLYAGEMTNSNFTNNTFKVGGTKAAIYVAAKNLGSTWSGHNLWDSNIFVGTTTQMAFGTEGSDNIFTNNDLTALNIVNKDKIIEFHANGHGNVASGNTFNPAQPAITVKSATQNRGTFTTFDKALNVAQVGDTIMLDTNITTTKQITISKDNITFDGQNHTITPVFTKTSGSNNSALGVINANNVHIRQLTIDGSQGTQLHGINIYNSSVPEIWRVSLNNSDRYGLVVGHNSWAQGIDLYTNNSARNSVVTDNWTAGGAVDVDGNSTFQDAGINRHNETTVFTINGVTKPLPALYIDNVNEGTIADSNNQYVYINNYWHSGDRAYFLKSTAPAAPTSLKTVDVTTGHDVADNSNFVTNPTKVTNSWSAVNGAVKYNYRFHDYDGHVYSMTTTAHSKTGAINWKNHTKTDGKYWFEVQAVAASGLKSDWVASVPFTVDTEAPAKVTGLAVYNGSKKITSGYTNIAAVVTGWDDISDSAKYEYCYWNNIATSSIRESNCYTAYPTSNQQPGTYNQGEGENFVKVRAIDAAGNVGQWSDTVTVVYDKTASVLTIDTSYRVNGDGTYTISGTTDSTDGVTVTFAGITTTVTPVNGVWRITTGAIADGTYTATAKSTDAAGNEATATRTYTNVHTPISGQQATVEPPANALRAPARPPQFLAATNPSSVLGDSTEATAAPKSTKTPQVEGASTTKSDDNAAKAGGMAAWFWWILAAAIALFIWWLIAAARKRASDNN